MNEVSSRLQVDADLDFAVELPGRAPVRGTLRGRAGDLELRVEDPSAFAGRADRDALRTLAGALARRGLRVVVVADAGPLLELGDVRSSWWSRLATGSAHLRVAGPRGAWAGLRGRLRPAADPVLPGERLVPPGTLVPLAPTFLRRRRGPVTTTHDPERGGRPRLVLTADSESAPDTGQRTFWLRAEALTLGSGADCDICLPGLEPLHAEVRHDADDEYVLLDRTGGSTLLNGVPVRQGVLRTGARITLGPATLTFARDEHADHGRPYGGRIGGELGHQRSQPDRPGVRDD